MCCITTNASPRAGGTFRKNSCNASNPPADAPMPTTRSGVSSTAAGSTEVADAGGRFRGDFRGGCAEASSAIIRHKPKVSPAPDWRTRTRRLCLGNRNLRSAGSRAPSGASRAAITSSPTSCRQAIREIWAVSTDVPVVVSVGIEAAGVELIGADGTSLASLTAASSRCWTGTVPDSAVVGGSLTVTHPSTVHVDVVRLVWQVRQPA